jgi:hypothetical protein
MNAARYAVFVALAAILFSPVRLGFSMKRRAGGATVLER